MSNFTSAENTPNHHKSRVALVTGASRGIGLAIVERLLRDGISVVLAARTLADIENSLESLAVDAEKVFVHEVDVTSETSVTALIKAIEERFGRLDIVVNNAGYAPRVNGAKSRVEDTTLEDWTYTLTVNLTGVFLITRAAIPLLRRSGTGRIVNIGSRAGRTVSELASAHYSAAKAGLIGFSRVLAAELGADKITVNCCCPTRVASAMANTVRNAPAVDAVFISETPIGRIGIPDDVSAAVAYFVSEQAEFVTGAILDITGGQFMP